MQIGARKMNTKLTLSLLLILNFAATALAQYQAQYGYRSPYYAQPAPSTSYSPYFAPSVPYYYPGSTSRSFDGGLYGTYGGYQPLGVNSGRGYANPPYIYSSPGAAPLLSMDGGTYSLSAQRRLQSLLRNTKPASRGEIKIIHKKDAASEVHYTLSGAKFTIKPGEDQTFADDRNWVIAIENSSTPESSSPEINTKPRRYTLKAGTYQFVPAEGGWNIKEVVPRS